MRRRTLLAVGGAAIPAAAALPGRDEKRPSWAHTWTAMPQLTEPHNLPPAPFAALADTTLRQTVHVTIGGRQLRVRFSNAFGTGPLPITAASVGLPLGGRAGVPAVEPGSTRPLTFGGRPSVVVPVGAQIVSDPVSLPVGAAANLTISAYLATGLTGGAVTGHPGSRTTSYLVNGDRHADEDLPGAVGTDHWYLISAVEVRASVAALAIVGDSLTDGRGSTTNGNDRWPDQLFARGSKVAVLNQAAGGNRVLNDGLGPNVLARLDRDVLAVGNVDRMLLFEGVNDIGTAEATEQAQKQVVDDLLVAYDQIVLRAHAAGLTAYGATLTPFGGNTGYDDPEGLRRRSRRAVNEAVHRIFDGVADFDAASRDPSAPETLLPAYDTGDHLHLNPAGYAALARAVPRRWI
ncbi:SGNH/GDSL hydrolase family protein [Paractinoplanes atraurantiacus]|uniref:Lysophospholipase L1 n=1 Tax=Paractinoplanes atraurantiacus TaxID=1036182 RepID=A0A285J4G6_9ACTN|nr:SGNH/GDSL hydrolase family protein [Actinoplanes atraurantiacus]SNY55102.1 Lysophospholipase L1 [Actinoplanes atraurantiacus]